MAALVLAGLSSWTAGSNRWLRFTGSPASAGRAHGSAVPEIASVPAGTTKPRPDASREDAIRRAALDRHFRARLQHPDPRQRLIALYMLTLSAPDASMAAARRRARIEAARLHASAPDDPLLALAQTWFCGGTGADACTSAERAAWARVEPGNAAAHLAAIDDARGSPVGVDQALSRMADAERYDSGIHDVALEVVVAFDDYLPPSLGNDERRSLGEAGLGHDVASRRQLAAMQYAWATPFPSYSGISRSCRPPLPAARLRSCHIALARMAGASTMIERAVALSGLQRLAQGTPEGAHWARELRRHRWWNSQLPGLTMGAAYWRDFVRHGDVEALRRTLLRAGIPLDSPPGWQYR